jgi:hypothetical protein
MTQRSSPFGTSTPEVYSNLVEAHFQAQQPWELAKFQFFGREWIDSQTMEITEDH